MDTVHTVHMRCSHVGVFFQMLKIYVGRSEESFRWDYFLFPCVFCDVYRLNKVISHNTCFWPSFHTWVIFFFPLKKNPKGLVVDFQLLRGWHSSWKSAGKWPAVSEMATWCQHFHCLQGWLYKGLLPEGSWPQLSDLICSADSSSGKQIKKCISKTLTIKIKSIRTVIGKSVPVVT